MFTYMSLRSTMSYFLSVMTAYGQSSIEILHLDTAKRIHDISKRVRSSENNHANMQQIHFYRHTIPLGRGKWRWSNYQQPQLPRANMEHSDLATKLYWLFYADIKHTFLVLEGCIHQNSIYASVEYCYLKDSSRIMLLDGREQNGGLMAVNNTIRW